MSIGTDIIQDAAREIGAHSINAPLDADSLIVGMNKLNSMLHLWLSRGIDLGIVPLSVPGDELSEPADTRSVIVWGLAIDLSPSFARQGGVVGRELSSVFKRDFNLMRQLYQNLSIPNKVPSALLPMGEGSSRGVDRRIFAGEDAEITDEVN